MKMCLCAAIKAKRHSVQEALQTPQALEEYQIDVIQISAVSDSRWLSASEYNGHITLKYKAVRLIQRKKLRMQETWRHLKEDLSLVCEGVFWL